MRGLETVSEHACYGGLQGFYRHSSSVCGGSMGFSVYRPPAVADGSCPVLYYLAGLTCTEETFMIKAGAQRMAAELGLVLVAPDTSPRDTGIDGATDAWDFGEGAGFYLDAIRSPWDRQFNMASYISRELPEVVAANFSVDPSRSGIFGHSMGGHGALTLALKNPDQYSSVSAFAPIVAPMEVPWGQKAFSRYLGDDQTQWENHDACRLVAAKTFDGTILIDQGLADNFLHEQLQPERFQAACQTAGQSLELRFHEGYDHGYYFISTFMDDHLRHHAACLKAG